MEPQLHKRKYRGVKIAIKNMEQQQPNRGRGPIGMISNMVDVELPAIKVTDPNGEMKTLDKATVAAIRTEKQSAVKSGTIVTK